VKEICERLDQAISIAKAAQAGSNEWPSEPVAAILCATDTYDT
jgi:hypothetical protein